MWLNRFWSGIVPMTSGVKFLFHDEIQVAPTFLKAIERERARCDRGGCGFSILSYEMFDESGREQAEREFCEFLISRTREMDTLGWFDERHLAVLMPETPPTNARVLALAVAKAFPSGLSPRYRILGYPADDSRWSNGAPKTAPENGNHGRTRRPSREESDRYPGAGAAAQTNDGSRQPLGLVHELLFGVNPAWWKRGMDLAISLMLIVPTAPLMALIALFIKAVSPGPILLCQERVGHRGRIFRLYKFRTMHLGVDNSEHRKYMTCLIEGDMPMIKIDSGADPRLIPGARLLRKTCLDELPQLINVIKGEMSLIGPRPCLPYEAAAFLRWHHRRFDIMPGITGLWQVNGKNKTTFRQMILYDIEYGKKASFWLDLTILLKTVPALLTMAFEQHSELKRALSVAESVESPEPHAIESNG